MIRVGFWSPCLHRAGGTETWHETLMANLDRSRVEVVGLAVSTPDECDPIRAEAMRRFCPVFVGEMGCAFLACGVDVLVMWGLGRPYELFPQPPLSRSHRPRTVFVVHGDGASPWNVESAAEASPDIDHYVAVSQAAVESVPPDRRQDCTVILNGVDLDRLRPTIPRYEQRHLWGLPPDVKVVGFLGRASREKDPYALARCVRYLPEGWVGVFVGDGDDFPNVRADAWVQTPGHVYFVEPTNEVGNVLNAFDVLLVPSFGEGFGYSAVEGLLAGVRVVATVVGIVGELNNFIWTVPIGSDGKTLARAVCTASGQFGELPMLTMQRAMIEERYGAPAFGRRWSDFLVNIAKPEPCHA